MANGQLPPGELIYYSPEGPAAEVSSAVPVPAAGVEAAGLGTVPNLAAAKLTAPQKRGAQCSFRNEILSRNLKTLHTSEYLSKNSQLNFAMQLYSGCSCILGAAAFCGAAGAAVFCEPPSSMSYGAVVLSLTPSINLV